MAHRSLVGRAAVVLSMLAGIEIVLVGLMLTFGGGIFSSSYQGVGEYFGITGMAWGILIIISAYMMYFGNRHHVIWGSLIIVFSIASIFGALGGFFLGLLLGIIGGILGIVNAHNQGSLEGTGSVELPIR